MLASFLLVVFLLLLPIAVSGQETSASERDLDSLIGSRPPTPGPLLRYSGRMLSLSVGGGTSLYQGEFEARGSVFHGSVAAGYTVFPELEVSLNADIGRLGLRRAADGQDALLYDFQFPSSPAGVLDRSVSFSSFVLAATVNFFPRMFFNAFLTAGVGVTFFDAEDFSEARVRPAAEFPAAVTAPIGVGVEYFLTRSMSAALTLRQHFTFRGDIDAFDPAEIASEYNRRRQPRIAVPEGGNDHFLSIGISLNWYLFESDDYDGDLLTNAEEEALGTSPYHMDTDDDGLTDFEEVRIYGTNPLKWDTDDDGLGDYLEIMRYNTNPLKPDTDDDGLTDYEEIMTHRTDPRHPDTDRDGLTDYEEVILYNTNPLNPDTDYDGLDDYAEVMIYGTNPLHPDTDDDGIYDFNEVITYRTNPLSADTDGDGLTDYEEIAIYGTDPLKADTDGDGLSDYVEIFITFTNPLRYDADPPPIPSDTSPHLAELLETQPLPGGGVAYLIAPAPVHRTAGVFGRSVDEAFPASAIDSTLMDEHGERPLAAPDADTYRRRSVQYIPSANPSKRRTMLRLESLELKTGDMLSFCNITFEFDRDELQQEYVPILGEAARLFERYSGMMVEVRGHTDMLGEKGYNQTLSERRAKSVKEFFISKGVDGRRLLTVGFGETRPIDESDTEEGRAKNRRVELFILSMDGNMPSER
jgi:outer membrane protein OmpA-like peptidoglycan-associated protein